MIKHIVIWKLKDFAEGAGKKENARIIKSKLEGLEHKIKVIKFIKVGININESDDAYDVALYSKFDSEADLKVFQNHPEHIKAGDFISKVRLERKVVDYKD